MEKKVHVLVMAFSMQGHINPMLHLSTNLAFLGVRVTFLLPHDLKAAMDNARSEKGLPPPHLLGLPLRFLSFPATEDDISVSEFSVPQNGRGGDRGPMPGMFEKMEGQRGFVEETILGSRNEAQDMGPISCVISDAFLPWTQDVANKLGIKRVLASTNNAMFLYMSLLISMGKLNLKDGTPSAEDYFPSLDVATKTGLLDKRSEFHKKRSKHHDRKGMGEERRKKHDMYNGFEESVCVIVNSFEELEGYVVKDASRVGISQVRFLGPMLPPSFFGMDTAHIEASIIGSSKWKEEGDCIEWLDTQAPSSVLYISFGSAMVLSCDQVKELASGIEMSQQPFLWVLRLPAIEQLPQGFLERSRGLGLVVSWAPQLRVLRHTTVGGYVTHCGWNSTLESICAGVPMLCLPFFADQPENSVLITNYWKVGMMLEMTQVGEGKVDEGGDMMMVVAKGEVEKKVRALMRGEQDGDNDIISLRHRCVELREAARRAAFGSMKEQLQKLIADLHIFPEPQS